MTDGGTRTGPLIAAVGLVSAAVLAFEIALMRLLLAAGWHHFAFLVISVVLLGYGASGTALTLARRRVLPRRGPVLFSLLLGTAFAMPAAWAVAQHVPIEARVVPGMVGRQAAAWIACWAVLSVPLLLGAAAVALGLMSAPSRTGAVYGASLLGSAGGSLAAPLAMTVLAPAWLPAACGAVALAGAAVLAGRRAARWAALAAAVVVAGAWLALDAPSVRLDSYKYGAYLRRLQAQGSVERVDRRFGPRAIVEAWRGAALHDLPFLSVGEAPPPLAVLTADGHLAGSVLEVGRPEEATVVDRMLAAFAYELAGPQPVVALLGEAGGAGAWLAARRGAARIWVVQPDRNLLRPLRGPLADHGGAVLELPGVAVRVAEPRAFAERPPEALDLLQLASMESSAAGSGGVGGLAENHLVTVEGIAACLDALAPRGVLSVSRGIQSPPRDNVKLFATILEALRRRGAADPAAHVVVVRDYLAVCTVVRPEPFGPGDAETVRDACARRELTPVWFPGVRPEELNRPDALPPAPDGVGDQYHYALGRLAGPGRRAFIDRWVFDVRPPTDDRPFFADFCRLEALGAVRDALGDLWLTRVELAYLFVVAAAGIVTAAGAAATLLPLPFLRGGAERGRAAVCGYFAALGLGYLLLEMVVLSRLTFLVGDPVVAAAVTIGGLLFFSGLGSAASGRLARPARAAGAAAAVLALLALLVAPGLARAAASTGGLPVAARVATGLVLVAPMGLIMGLPMPLGLARLAGRRVDAGEDAPAALVPWAWGINGFASVLAPPLAMILAMAWGFTAVAVLAAAAYATAALLFSRLPEADG